ncbi:hypothetical protein CGRA01v4_08778 [Colletotrichum graminicola]|nr:hypothetical protein CGRA01v4_08778 [Colletotrichum graminicola]
MLHLVFIPHVIVLRIPRSRSMAYMDSGDMFGMCEHSWSSYRYIAHECNAGIDEAAMCPSPHRLFATSSQLAVS